MMVLGLGIDLVDIAQFEYRLKSAAFRRRVFTEAEIAIATNRRKAAECFAGKFAVKEAVMKCLGAGIQQGIWFTHIEVLNAPAGVALLTLHKHALSLATERGICQWQISISHTAQTTGAVVLALGL